MILLFVGAVAAVAWVFAAIAAWRAPLQSSPGIFVATLGSVWLTADLFRTMGILLAFQAVANAPADQKQHILSSGISAAMEPLVPAAVAMLAILATHLWGLSRVRAAGRPVLTGPGIALNLLAALPVVASLVLQARWVSFLWTGVVPQSAATTMYSSSTAAILGVPAEGVLTVAALAVGFGLARREARLHEDEPAP